MDADLPIFRYASDEGIVRAGKLIYEIVGHGAKTETELASMYLLGLPDNVIADNVSALGEVENFWAATAILLKNGLIYKKHGFFYVAQ